MDTGQLPPPPTRPAGTAAGLTPDRGFRAEDCRRGRQRDLRRIGGTAPARPCALAAREALRTGRSPSLQRKRACGLRQIASRELAPCAGLSRKRTSPKPGKRNYSSAPARMATKSKTRRSDRIIRDQSRGEKPCRPGSARLVPAGVVFGTGPHSGCHRDLCSSVWQAGFVWDDDFHLTKNPASSARTGSWESGPRTKYQIFPLVISTFWLEHALWALRRCLIICQCRLCRR